MNTTKVTSILLGFIADCSVRLNKIGIHHLQIEKGLLQAWDRHCDLYIDVGLQLPSECDPDVFKLQVETSPVNVKLMRSIGKRGGDLELTVFEDKYLISDDYTQVEIPKLNIKASPISISQFTGSLDKQGSDIEAITGKGELSITGTETYVLLSIYGGQLASITLPGQSEQFFGQKIARQMKRKPQEQYKSYNFLKFGEPDYKISIYTDHKKVWLLTEGQFIDGITYQVLEKLTPII